MTEIESYQEKINQEAEHWGKFEEESLRYGIPWWVDLRRAEKIKRSQNGAWFDDPVVENILRGREKNYVIANASRNKGRALDLGCGSGWLSLELARNGMFVDGVEVSGKRIEIARRFLKENPFIKNFGEINYQIGDLNHIKLGDNTYDSVVAYDSLHHIQNLDHLMREIEKSLRSNGNLLIYDHIGRKITLVEKVYKKIKKILERMLFRLRLIKCEMKSTTSSLHLDKSPFEDVRGDVGDQMIEIINRYFNVKLLKFRLSPIIMIAVQKIKSYKLLFLLANLDRFLCDIHLVRGEYIFIHAKKRK